MAVLALKDDFIEGWPPRKLPPDLICQSAKKNIATAKESSFLEGPKPPSKLILLRVNNETL